MCDRADLRWSLLLMAFGVFKTIIVTSVKLLFFCFVALFVTICSTDLLLICSILIDLLFDLIPVLYSTVGAWYIPALHVVFLRGVSGK